MIKMEIFKTREKWLEARTGYIGGSDAAAVIGQNPWMSNVDLWKVKTGRLSKPFKTNEAIEYGNNAERLVAEIFKLDHPTYAVEYVEHNMWLNTDYPFGHASLDGWYFDEDGKMGILEIKTGNVYSAASWHKWNGQIPQNYYCQILHYMAITGAQSAIVKALLKGNRETYLREYRFERDECAEDIEYLMNEERAFCELIKKDIEPNLILNL